MNKRSNELLREAAIVLPATMADIEVEHESTLDKIMDVFGGFTLVPAIGGWRGADGVNEIEPVVTVSIAMLPSLDNHAKLEEIADDFGRRYKQKAMYVRYADGVVAIRPVTSAAVEQNKEPVPA